MAETGLADSTRTGAPAGRTDHSVTRERLLADLPIEEERIRLAGVSTVVLRGGEGPPLVLLHGPGEHAPKWCRVIPDLVRTHAVVAPDLPGHGASEVTRGELSADRVLDWLGELIERTCPVPPALVGQIVGGAIAARFASRASAPIARLVLVDSLGLAPFRPAPEFGRALLAFVAGPTEETHDALWQRCAYDLDTLRDGMGERWEDLRSYNLDRARAATVQTAQSSLMDQFGMPAIPHGTLARIAVPTALIWGRHDLATPLPVAEAASARYGWPLHVIENAADDPPMEQPREFLDVLRTMLTVS